jgi:uncharacterized protein YjiS (DUF1127 family)
MAGRFFIASAEESFASHNEAAGTLFGRIAAAFRAWAERQDVKTELENLDPRTLADLGIMPNDFRAIVDGTYRRG